MRYMLFKKKYFLPFCLFQSDFLSLGTVLHQQSVCCPLSSRRPRSNTSQGCQQGQKEELKILLAVS